MVLAGFVGGCRWFWLVLVGFGWFWVVPCFSNYGREVNSDVMEQRNSFTS